MDFTQKAADLAQGQARALEGLEEAARVLAWDGDALAVTDSNSEVMVKLRKDRLSPSTANSMKECLARWAVEQVFRGPGDPFSPAESGTSAHAVLEDLFAQPVGKRTREMAEFLLQSVHERHPELSMPGDPLTMAKWRDKIRVLISGLWDIEDPTRVHVLAREKQLDTSEIDGVPFKGFIDRLDLWNNGLAIRDYKSGAVKTPEKLRKYGDEQGEQQRMYALAMENLDGVLPGEATLYYTQFGESRDISLSSTALSKTRREFVKSWETLQLATQTQRYSTKTSGLCAYCPLATVCPTANRDREVRPKNSEYVIGELLHLSVLEPSRTTVRVPMRLDAGVDFESDMDALYGNVSDEDLADAPEFDDESSVLASSFEDDQPMLPIVEDAVEPSADPMPDEPAESGPADLAAEPESRSEAGWPAAISPELSSFLWGLIDEIGDSGLTWG